MRLDVEWHDQFDRASNRDLDLRVAIERDGDLLCLNCSRERFDFRIHACCTHRFVLVIPSREMKEVAYQS